MNSNVVICGLGGQGVVFLTRLLARAAMDLGHPVMVSETHGMSQRGGSVISHLKIAGNQAPLIQSGTADVMLAMEADEAVRNLPFLRSGGVVFVNATGGLREEVLPDLERLEIRVHDVAASQHALQLGTPAIANVVLAGFCTAFPAFPLPGETLRSSLTQVAKRNLDLNMKAFDAGRAIGQESLVITT